MTSRQAMLYVTLVAIYTVHVFRSGERKRAQQANCSHHGVGAGIVHAGDHSIGAGIVHTGGHSIGASVDVARSCPFDIGLIGFRGCLRSSGTGQNLGVRAPGWGIARKHRRCQDARLSQPVDLHASERHCIERL